MAAKVDVLCLPGTFMPHGEPMSDTFMASLDQGRFNPVYVEYPADYGDPVPYADSRQAGYDNLSAAAGLRYPDPVWVYGYSQGAWGAGKLADDAARGLANVNIAGVALMADPMRPAGVPLVSGTAGGYGIGGQRTIDAAMTAFWAAVADDPITSLPGGNPLRLIPDISEYWSLSSEAAVVRWLGSLIEVAVQRKLQPWWTIDHWRDWPGAIEWALNYLIRGRHTTAYIDEGHAAALAAAVNAVAVE